MLWLTKVGALHSPVVLWRVKAERSGIIYVQLRLAVAMVSGRLAITGPAGIFTITVLLAVVSQP